MHATHLYEHLEGFLRGALLPDIQRVHDALHHGPRGGLELVPVRRLVQILRRSDRPERTLNGKLHGDRAGPGAESHASQQDHTVHFGLAAFCAPE